MAITCGDPAGVGPEVIERWLAEADLGRDATTLLGPRRWLERLPDIAGVERMEVGGGLQVPEPGRPTLAGCRIAFQALEMAAQGCREGRFDAVITGPISKIGMREAGFEFPGQSEFFAARWRGEPTMAFTGGRLRVALATWHIPLRDVPTSIDEAAIVRTVTHADLLARAEGCTEPRIAVCGLNPHAGEGGMLGKEELETIDPWLDRLRTRFPGLSRCLPPDTVFARSLAGEFDVAVALYHDQGLGPLKTVDFDTAVNVTLGLEWIRTSPDHGTAFGIAGKGVARATSFANAVVVARRLAEYRAR
ncbi:4-hydroxythreonine-4-phosphate dehydrogenase PdxA [Opitutales bacterium ASA1]|nr:4-hydroxythreonine-4-phosphate dehydrogenase PdxA [Opitutales bacterium ASA1]